MTKQTNVFPKKRFEEFKHAQTWKQCTLGEVATIVGGGTPSTSNKEYWNGNINWYSPVEIGEQIYVHSSQKKITELGLQKSSAKILPVGTILFTSRAGIGNTAILAVEGATNQGFQSIVPHKNQLDPYFIYSRTHELKQYGEINGAGSTFVEVSGKQMAKMPILIPPLEEQRKIGRFFKHLDDLILLQQRKIQKTKALKDAYLSEMFPSEGKLSPKRRFAGFTQDWKCIELKEIVDLLKDGTHGTHANGNDAFLLSAKNIKNGQVIINKLVDRKISSYDYDLIFKNYKLIQQDLLVTIVGTIGQTALYTESTSKIAFQRSVAIIRGRKNIDQSFLKFTIDSSYVQKQLKQFSSMSAQAGVYLGDLEKLELFVPELSEQKKIGSSLNQLDQLIQSQQKKLEKLQNLKKAYLHEMFV